jgi:hypothetical protein
MLKSRAAQYSNVDQNDVTIALKAYRDSDQYDPEKTVSDILVDEFDFDEDEIKNKPYTIAAGVNAYKKIFEETVMAGGMGNDMEAYKQAALMEWKSQWVPINMGTAGGVDVPVVGNVGGTQIQQLVRGRNSFYTAVSGDKDIADELILESLQAGELNKLAEDWAAGNTFIEPVRDNNLTDTFILYERQYDSDGNLTMNRAVLNKDGTFATVSVGDRVKVTRERRESEALAVEAENESDDLAQFDKDSSAMVAMKQDLLRWLAGESGSISRTNELMDEVFGNAYDSTMSALNELMARLLKADPASMEEMPVEFFYSNKGDFSGVELTNSQNDYLWHGFLEIEARKMENANAQAEERGMTIPFPEDVFNERMAKQRHKYKMRGLHDPAERPE